MAIGSRAETTDCTDHTDRRPLLPSFSALEIVAPDMQSDGSLEKFMLLQ